MSVITTKGSWFNDTTTSSGKSAASTVGIAVGSPSVGGGLNLGPGIGGTATLNGYFLVKDPGGRLHIFQQIDTGPAGFTGRGLDYSQASLSHLAGGDPTDKNSELVYLGKTKTDITNNLNAALAQMGAKPVSDPSLYGDAATQLGFADLNKIPTSLGTTTGQAGLGAAASTAGSAVSGVASAITAPLEVAVQIWKALTNPSNWLRALKLVAGAVAIYFGLKQLSGSPGVTEIASTVRP
jgi:hypothetical protein